MTDEGKVVLGDLRIVESGNDSRIVLVTKTSDYFCEVLLVHAMAELATSMDIVIQNKCTTMPYNIVVQTDLRSVVENRRMEKLVGKLSWSSMKRFQKWTGDGGPFEEAGMNNGTPLAGVNDQRWEFKESEGIALRQLAASFAEVLISEGYEYH
jgi:hypothetical protein